MKYVLFLLVLVFSLSGCGEPSSDQKQSAQQERILMEGTNSIGMPSIVNFRERRLLKDILELRDQDGISTYTYIVAEQTGKFIFLCDSIGYGLPAATQFTNPQKLDMGAGHYVVLPQADPNGLFSPSSAEGTWVMCVDSTKKKALPTYVEPRIITSPYKLSN